MGCATSKIDDLPAVILCKERLDFLNLALHQRYLLSDCHVSYIHSLTSIGVSLHRFFQSATTLPPPIVTKAPQNDVAHRRSSSSSSGHISLSNSPSGSHLHFHSDSDHDHDHLNGHTQDLSDSDSEIHSPRKSNPNPNTNPYEGEGSGSNGAYPYSYPYPYPHPYQQPFVNNGKGNGNYMQMNYMKKHVTPSVRYEQRPVYPETIQQFGEASSSSSNYSNTNYGNSYGYMNYGAETSKKAATPAVVPPPPPPASSTWDFLNPFESIESNYPTAYNNNTPSSRDSREVREEEGIPELEDEDFDHFGKFDKFDNEVVKEVVHGHKKVVLNDNHFETPSSSGNGGRKSEVESIESDESDDDGIEVEKMGEYEVEVVEKKVVRDEGIKGENSGKGGAGGGYKSVFEVVKEIQVQFERAAACGDQIAKVLEVGKLRYNRKNTAFQGGVFFF